MDRRKVEMLREIANINRKYQWAKVQQDVRLVRASEAEWTIKSDAIYATRLYYFGLIDRTGRRDGLYRINALGLAFLRGDYLVPHTIWCKGGRVIERSTRLVGISQVKDVIVDRAYWAAYPSIQKYPGDPGEEAP
jgi:hypothetical protein